MLFADDTTLTCSNSVSNLATEKVTEAVKNAEVWFNSNYLKLNQQKTQQALFTSSNATYDSTSFRLLGLEIDTSLRWTSQIDSICKKLSSVIFLLRKLKQCVSFKVVRNTYFALFHSILTYGVIFWGNASDSLIVFRLQKRALRVMCGLNCREHCRPYFIEHRIMTLPCTYILHCVNEIHNHISEYTFQNQIHSHNTRSAHEIRTTKFRLQKSKKNSLDVSLYNKLPLSIRNSNTNYFKNYMKQFLLSNAFYSVKEFRDHVF